MATPAIRDPGKQPAAHGGGLAAFEAPSLSALLDAPLNSELQQLLCEHIHSRRWFRGKARSLSGIEVLDHVPLRAAPHDLTLVFVRALYAEGESEIYVLPLGFSPAGHPKSASQLFALLPERGESVAGVVHDPSGSDDLSQLLLGMLSRTQTEGKRGQLRALAHPALQARLQPAQPTLTARVPSGEQSNTTVFYGDELTLKLFRQLEPGDNPDVELNQFLWASGYRHVPEPVGSVSYEHDGFTTTLAIAQRFVPSQGPAWDVMLEMLQRTFELVLSTLSTLSTLPTLSTKRSPTPPELPSPDLLEASEQGLPPSVAELLGEQAGFVKLLGERTAELHIALASDEHTPAFKPEPFTHDYQLASVQTTIERVRNMYELLAKQLPTLHDATRPLAQEVIASRDALQQQLHALQEMQVHASRIRCHGDYHLGQVLYGDGDFTILDFEGEPAQPLVVRRQKRSALYDVCGMLRSFHYAATVALQSESFQPDDRIALAGWSEAWYRWTSAQFLGAYLHTVRERSPTAVFLPEAPEELRALLNLHMIDKCSYEVGYELNNRPAWVSVPLAGLLSLIER